MADNETSKITWIAITVALAATVYGTASGTLPALANTAFAKVGKMVQSIKLPSDTNSETPSEDRPNVSDSKWVIVKDYGSNGLLAVDKDDNALIFAKDSSKAIDLSPDTQPDGLQIQTLLMGAEMKSGDSYMGSIKTLKILDPITLSGSANMMFSNLTDIESIDGLSKLNTTNMTSMTNMFAGMSKLKTLDVSTFNTHKVTSMLGAFSDLPEIQSLNVSNFDWSALEEGGGSVMFSNMDKTATITAKNITKGATYKPFGSDTPTTSVPDSEIKDQLIDSDASGQQLDAVWQFITGNSGVK